MTSLTLTGGPVFWLLLLLGLVALVIFFERLLEMRRCQINVQDFVNGVTNILDSGNEEEALDICEETSVPVASVVATAIRHRTGSARLLREAVDAQGRTETGRLDRRLAALAIIGQIAPAVGLFGTIIGFVKVVMLVNSGAIVCRGDMLSATVQALVSAALGLGVAIPVVVMYGSLRTRMDRIVSDLESAASMIIGYITTAKEAQR